MTSRLEKSVSVLSSSALWSNDDLSYRQLIPIHEALITSSTDDDDDIIIHKTTSKELEVIEETNDDDNDNDSNECRDEINIKEENDYNPFQWIDESFAVEEKEFMIEVLNDNERSQKTSKLYRLFFIQYFCHFLLKEQNDGTSSSFIILERLIKIVVPLVQHSKMIQEEEEEDSDDEFREAFLDVIFRCDGETQQTKRTDDIDKEGELLSSLQKQLFQTTSIIIEKSLMDSSSASFSWICRIVVRLIEFLRETRNDDEKNTVLLVLAEEKLVLPLILYGMQYIQSLSPVLVWLLPLIVSQQYSDDDDSNHRRRRKIVEYIWNECLKFISLVLKEEENDIRRGKQDEITRIVSATLCTILPHLTSTQLPTTITMKYCENDTKQYENAEERCLLIPLHQPIIWNFIKHLLHRGNYKHIILTKSGTFQSETTSEPILRRRGLYLLRQLLLINDNIEDNSTDLMIWMKYVSCFETLEMEFEQHLIDQVWNTVAELCEVAADVIVADDDLKDSCFPSMSWEWISALLGRIMVSDTPVLRKLGLYRFLNGEAGIRINPITSQAQEDRCDDDDDLLALKRYLHRQPQKKKGAIPSSTLHTSDVGAPLSLVSTDFILKAIIPSFDTIASSIGTRMSYECNGKIETQDLTEKFDQFIVAWVQQQQQQSNDDDCNSEWEAFMQGILSSEILGLLRPKTTVLLLCSIVQGLSTSIQKSSPWITKKNYESIVWTAVRSFRKFFNEKQVVITYRQSMLRDFAILLSFLSSGPKVAKNRRLRRIQPDTILGVLSLYNNSDLLLMHSSEERGKPTTRAALQHWIEIIQEENDEKNRNKNDNSSSSSLNWISRVVRDCSTSFVQLELVPLNSKVWDPIEPSNESERTMANTIILLSSLLPNQKDTDGERNNNEDGDRDHVSSLLWPAIYQGLLLDKLNDSDNSCSNPSLTASGNDDHSKWKKARKMHRAIMLFENACAMGVINSKKINVTTIMLTSVAGATVEALINHINILFLPQTIHDSGCSSTSITNKVGSTYANIISQFCILGQYYQSSPSSMDGEQLVVMKTLVESAVQVILTKKQPIINRTNDNEGIVLAISLLHAILSLSFRVNNESCSITDTDSTIADIFSTIVGRDDILIGLCVKLLKLEFGSVSSKKEENSDGLVYREYAVPTVFSIFQYARWGCLSILVPKLLQERTSRQQVALMKLCEEIFTTCHEVVANTPTDALLPLFNTICNASQHWFSFRHQQSQEDNDDDDGYPLHLKHIQVSLFSALMDMTMSSSYVYMLNKLCALLFQSPTLLYNEYNRLEIDPEYPAPIREAFFTLVKKSGIHRSHILQAALSHICAGWLGISPYNDLKNISTVTPAGLGAIPYRDEIVKLLVHKEVKMDISSIKQSVLLSQSSHDGSVTNRSSALSLPAGTDEASFARGYLLCFLSHLPGPNDDGFDQIVLDQLIYPIILKLLGKQYCFAPIKGSSGSIMTGSPEYSLRIRSWQALCILSRFLISYTADKEVISKVCDAVFRSLEPNLHGEIRYFIEIFAIQLSRHHPHVFMKRYIEHEIGRKNLTLQHISSLMIIGGHLVIGKYRFHSLLESSSEKSPSISKKNKDQPYSCNDTALHQMLRGIIPWLSSTQGFSRALAQFLVHSLIPLVINILPEAKNINDGASKEEKTDEEYWYLWRFYQFLEKNPDMSRLRKKLFGLFERYDVDHTCTAEGVLTVPVDESDETKPEYLIDFIKRGLEEVYLESRADEAPVWKQRIELLRQQEEKDEEFHTIDNNQDDVLMNFQRKIIPFHALDLEMDTKNQDLRQKKKFSQNTSKESLIVCASLINDVPYLAGLARTAEIFAADQLIIPDRKVVKMDNFKSISVTAGDWIPIEECKEKDLIPWIQNKKENEGYTIIGLEQTRMRPTGTSSKTTLSMNKIQFPKRTILLFGKEKEGIPIPFHSYVDQFIPILPHQLGITRELSVHITGAIGIWEYTRQQL